MNKWHEFDKEAPTASGHIWISDGIQQVHIAYWSMERLIAGTEEPDAGITSCPGWLGTEQPLYWMPADEPAPPQDSGNR